MPLIFRERQPHLTEIMDRDDCDPEMLENTYRQFWIINLLLSQWKRIYQQELKPLMNTSDSYSILDIGFGGGDVPIKISEWAKKDGIDLHITAIEIDQRSFFYSQSLEASGNIDFRFCSSADLVQEYQQYDFVISNHVLHHLNKKQTEQVLKEAKTLAKKKVVFNDIERSDTGYVLFSILSKFISRNSFIRPDGLTSIKRSYTYQELQKAAPNNWHVKRMFPFRLLLIHEA